MAKHNNRTQPATAADVSEGRAVFWVPDSRSEIYDLGLSLLTRVTVTTDIDIGDGEFIRAGTEITMNQAERVDGKEVLLCFVYPGGSSICNLDQLPDLKKTANGSMLEVKKLALQALRKAKEELQRDKHLLPRALV